MRVSLLAVLLVIAATPVLAVDEPEPLYEGKPLEYWVKRIRLAETWEQRQDAAVAIKAFGADAAPAVPHLVVMLEDRSSAYRGFIANVLCALGSHAKGAVPELTKRLKEKKARDPQSVISVLGAIGPDAKEAIPVLVTALDDPELSPVAVSALCKIGPATNALVPDLCRAVRTIVAQEEKGPNATGNLAGRLELAYRREGHAKEPVLGDGDHLGSLLLLGANAVPVLVTLIDAPGDCGKEYAVMLFCELGSKGEKGLPALKKLLKHETPEMRYAACVAVWKVAESSDVVPVLSELLTLKQVPVRRGAVDLSREAASMLGDIGPPAKEALPALKAAISKQRNEGGRRDIERVAEIEFYEALKEAIDKIEGKAKK